jgi:serum/glucocorticoid-regulated kinase 2
MYVFLSLNNCVRYGCEVDWWTLGALLFEMLTGLPPFYDADVQTMYQKILAQPLSVDGLSPLVSALLPVLICACVDYLVS